MKSLKLRNPTADLLKLVILGLTVVSVLSSSGCSNKGPATTPTETTGGGTPPTPPSPLDGQTFIPLTEFTDEITPASPNWAFLAEAIQIYFRQVQLPNGSYEYIEMPSTIEANSTGIQMIYSNTTGQLRFTSRTSVGQLTSNMVAIPGSGILDSSNVDMIFAPATSTWISEYAGAYSLVRVVGTHNLGVFSGSVCVRTTAVSDWDQYGNPLNMVGTLFHQAIVYHGYTSNGVTMSTLRSLVNCVNAGTNANIPNSPTKRIMGHFTTNIEEILP